MLVFTLVNSLSDVTVASVSYFIWTFSFWTLQGMLIFAVSPVHKIFYFDEDLSSGNP